MKTRTFILSLTLAGMLAASLSANACTGITLNSKDSTTIVARTIEWGGSDLNSQYVIVPRGYTMRSYTPDGSEGMQFTSRYGYVGLAVEQKEFIAEGINEAGLSAGLFYFPNYGHDRRSDREREAGARYPHRPARLYRTLAFYRPCRKTSGLGDYRWRTEVLREQVRRADQFPRIRMAADQPQ